MLLIILALAIGGLLLFAIATVGNGAEILGLFLVIGLTIVAIFLGIFGAISGYDEPEIVQRTEVVPLSGESEEEKLLYVHVASNGNVFCKVKVTDVSGEELYKLQKFPKDVEVFEEDTCEATLYKIVAKGKRSIWTFAVGTSDTTYVLVVPKGTVQIDTSDN